MVKNKSSDVGDDGLILPPPEEADVTMKTKYDMAHENTLKDNIANDLCYDILVKRSYLHLDENDHL
jgi:hypothetical protein